MKIVLDSNVILSALITQGVSSRVFTLCHERHTVFISEWIISEVLEKLKNKFKVPANKIRRTNDFLVNAFILINPDGEPPSICKDKDDNNILHLADFVNSDLIVTGDNDLLELVKYKNCKIINPRTFMEKYSKIN